MGKEKCELCGGVARIFCESDEASLCWDCDGKVHGANFLVAKHTRCLLCSACQSPTPWNASGLRLGPTVSICESCVVRKKNSVSAGRETRNRNPMDNLGREINGRYDFDGYRLRREYDGAESYDDDEEDDESDEEEEEEEAENQVVPWDTTAAAQQPPVLSSSSSIGIGDENFTGNGVPMAKRTRMGLDLNCSDEESNDSRPLKRLSRSTAKRNSILRLHGERKSNGCETSSSSSSSSPVSEIANKSRDLSR